MASKKLRWFKLETEHGRDRICRFLPFVETLQKQADQRNPEATQNASDLENMPDNTLKLTNICVKGLDECLTEEDLNLMFRKFGEIKSEKIARNPVTSKSLGYGYVWFAHEDACLNAIEASRESGTLGLVRIPYSCELY